MGYFKDLTKLQQMKREVAKLESKIAQNEMQLKKLPPDAYLATAMHELQCRQNHMDQCGWDYEKDWSEPTHKHYLDKAKKVIQSYGEEPPEEVVQKVVKCLCAMES